MRFTTALPIFPSPKVRWICDRAGFFGKSGFSGFFGFDTLHELPYKSLTAPDSIAAGRPRQVDKEVVRDSHSAIHNSGTFATAHLRVHLSLCLRILTTDSTSRADLRGFN